MSLIPANIECLAFAPQVDKDTAAAAPLIAVALEDCQLDPNVQRIKQAESDQSAQQGDVVVVGAQPGGSFKKYVRPSEEDFFLYALLGKNADSGTTHYTHTAEVDDTAPFTTPYLTVWDIWPGVMCVRYDGVRIASGHFMSKPGGMVEVEYQLEGLKSTYIDPGSAPDLSGLFVDELGHSWPELTATLGGSHTGVVNSFDCTISRATGRFPGDNGLFSLDVPNGLLSVTGSLEVAFQDDDLTRAANTGTTSGTVVTTTVFSEALTLALARGANLGVSLAMAAVQISNFKNALKTDASPAVSTFDFDSKRSATIADLITAVTKNDVATADRS